LWRRSWPWRGEFLALWEPSPQLILWRNTAGIGIHAICSFIFGLGINGTLLASIRGEIKFLSYGKRFFFTAMALHCIYNITVTVLNIWTGWME
jgi:RsiW-degrading membrane proteinase PrsW (M82 family)